MCAACKVIIDNYGSLGGASASMAVVAEASCQSLMAALNNPRVSKDQRKAILDMSEKCCDYADVMRAFEADLRAFCKKLAADTMTPDFK